MRTNRKFQLLRVGNVRECQEICQVLFHSRIVCGGLIHHTAPRPACGQLFTSGLLTERRAASRAGPACPRKSKTKRRMQRAARV